jgi:hypothetical protein
MNFQRFIERARMTSEIQTRLNLSTSVNEVVEIGKDYRHHFTERDVITAADQKQVLQLLPWFRKSQLSFTQRVKSWVRDHVVDDDPWDEE